MGGIMIFQRTIDFMTGRATTSQERTKSVKQHWAIGILRDGAALALAGLAILAVGSYTPLLKAAFEPITKELQTLMGGLQTLNKDLTRELRDVKVEIVRLQGGPVARVRAMEAATQLAKTLPPNMTTRPGTITADPKLKVLIVRDAGQMWTYSFTGSTLRAKRYNPQDPGVAPPIPVESLKSGSWGVVVHETGSQTATEVYQLPENPPHSPLP